MGGGGGWCSGAVCCGVVYETTTGECVIIHCCVRLVRRGCIHITHVADSIGTVRYQQNKGRRQAIVVLVRVYVIRYVLYTQI